MPTGTNFRYYESEELDITEAGEYAIETVVDHPTLDMQFHPAFAQVFVRERTNVAVNAAGSIGGNDDDYNDIAAIQTIGALLGLINLNIQGEGAVQPENTALKLKITTAPIFGLGGGCLKVVVLIIGTDRPAPEE